MVHWSLLLQQVECPPLDLSVARCSGPRPTTLPALPTTLRMKATYSYAFASQTANRELRRDRVGLAGVAAGGRLVTHAIPL